MFIKRYTEFTDSLINEGLISDIFNWTKSKVQNNKNKVDEYLELIKGAKKKYLKESEPIEEELSELNSKLGAISGNHQGKNEIMDSIETNKRALSTLSLSIQREIESFRKSCIRLCSDDPKLLGYFNLKESKIDSDFAKELWERSKKTGAYDTGILYNDWEKANDRYRESESVYNSINTEVAVEDTGIMPVTKFYQSSDELFKRDFSKLNKSEMVSLIDRMMEKRFRAEENINNAINDFKKLRNTSKKNRDHSMFYIAAEKIKEKSSRKRALRTMSTKRLDLAQKILHTKYGTK